MSEIVAYESNPIYTKIDDNTIQVTKQVVEPKIIVSKYELFYIENRILMLQQQKSELIEQIDNELTELNEILTQFGS